jgi:hypothetical protein
MYRSFKSYHSLHVYISQITITEILWGHIFGWITNPPTMIFGKTEKFLKFPITKKNCLNDFKSTLRVSSVYTVIQVLFCAYFMQYCNKTLSNFYKVISLVFITCSKIDITHHIITSPQQMGFYLYYMDGKVVIQQIKKVWPKGSCKRHSKNSSENETLKYEGRGHDLTSRDLF